MVTGFSKNMEVDQKAVASCRCGKVDSNFVNCNRRHGGKGGNCSNDDITDYGLRVAVPNGDARAREDVRNMQQMCVREIRVCIYI